MGTDGECANGVGGSFADDLLSEDLSAVGMVVDAPRQARHFTRAFAETLACSFVISRLLHCR